ncbi:hypothetical protein TNCV_3469971 [Trichonephila clavipes]|nr:hypothetical protein TNCV_3469971 [Trichonephila clavipes]
MEGKVWDDVLTDNAVLSREELLTNFYPTLQSACEKTSFLRMALQPSHFSSTVAVTVLSGIIRFQQRYMGNLHTYGIIYLSKHSRIESENSILQSI